MPKFVPMKKSRCSCLLAFVLLFAAAVASADTPLSDAVVRERANALIQQMTPEEKAGQLTQRFHFAQPGSKPDKNSELVAQGKLGAVLFVSGAAESNRLQRIAIEKSRLKIPLLVGFDVIHGLHTIFPVPLAMAATWDPPLVEDAQAIAAREARAAGIHWAFAPMIDIARDPRWGRIVESAGEDPYLGSAMAAAQVRGFQGPFIGSPEHIIAGPKHFVGYGAALGGRDYDEVDLSDSQLWNVYLPPFKAAVEAGAGNIMTAYMSLNGVPASANQWLLRRVLRDTWGFKGFVVSDAAAVLSLTTHGLAASPEEAAVRAVRAGVNVEMTPSNAAAMQSLPNALRAGKISMAEVDDAVRAVLEAKIRMGLFERPYVDEAKVPGVFNDPRHRDAARVAAERAAVLLRNDAGLLPLNHKTIKSIAVIGPLADSGRDTLGPWVFKHNDPPSISVLAGLQAKVGRSIRIDYSEGVRMPNRLHRSPFAFLDAPQPKKPPLNETTEIHRAAELARDADAAVLVLGEAQEMSGEQASRSSLDLPGRQQELLDAVVAVGKPVIVLLMSGRPLDIKDMKAQAVMQIWYPGSQGGAAVANLLFGDATPGGKLPFTWLRNAGQAPLIYSRLISHDPSNASRRYWNESNKPHFPFGHGLSYTTFEYSNLRIEREFYTRGEAVTVTVDLKNTGSRSGDEVAQLYTHQRWGTSARPVRELKGFQRVTLQPGETRRLTFVLRPEDLQYWSAATNGWVQDESKFDVWVGGDSAANLASTFEIKARS